MLLNDTMLARINRLTKKRSFEKVKEQGKLFQGQNFAIAVLARRDKEPCRFGFVVSNKISKKATIRNRIRRVLREAARANLPRLKAGFDVIFLVKKKILDVKTEEIGDEASSILKKAGLLR